jgi:hypothetical protein
MAIESAIVTPSTSTAGTSWRGLVFLNSATNNLQQLTIRLTELPTTRKSSIHKTKWKTDYCPRYDTHTLGFMLPIWNVECLILIRNACTFTLNVRVFQEFQASTPWRENLSLRRALITKLASIRTKTAIQKSCQTFESKRQPHAPRARTCIEAPQRYCAHLRSFLQDSVYCIETLRFLVTTIISKTKTINSNKMKHCIRDESVNAHRRLPSLGHVDVRCKYSARPKVSQTMHIQIQ